MSRKWWRSETKDENWGDLQKKKGHHLLVPRFVSFSSPKVEKFCNWAGVDLFFFFFFFFLGDHPNFRLWLQICTITTTIKPATASHRPAFVGESIEMSINLVKSVVFHRSKKRDLRSKKRDKASKSGTYGNPTHGSKRTKRVQGWSRQIMRGSFLLFAVLLLCETTMSFV